MSRILSRLIYRAFRPIVVLWPRRDCQCVNFYLVACNKPPPLVFCLKKNFLFDYSSRVSQDVGWCYEFARNRAQ